MKALILAAGKGSRLLPLTNNIPKPLIPLCNLPTLIFVIHKILKSGISNIGIVISPEHEQFFNKFLYEYEFQDSIELILQPEPLGVAHAVKEAKDFLDSENFLLYLGDNLISEDLGTFKDKFEIGSYDALLLLKKIDDPRKFGVAQLDSKGKLIDIQEKPLEPKSNLAVTGLYFFKNEIIDFIDKIKFSERNELEITDAINLAMNEQDNIFGVELNGWWVDTGSREQILDANRYIFEEIINGKFDDLYMDYEMNDKILLGKNSSVENISNGGFLIVGHNSIISNLKIDNTLSVGDNNLISNSTISNSIILDNNSITQAKIINSLVGPKSINGEINEIIDIIKS